MYRSSLNRSWNKPDVHDRYPPNLLLCACVHEELEVICQQTELVYCVGGLTGVIVNSHICDIDLYICIKNVYEYVLNAYIIEINVCGWDIWCVSFSITTYGRIFIKHSIAVAAYSRLASRFTGENFKEIDNSFIPVHCAAAPAHNTALAYICQFEFRLACS